MAKKTIQKINHSTTAEYDWAKGRSLITEEDEVTTSVLAENAEYRAGMVRTMRSWAAQPDSLEVMQFCIKHYINRWLLYRLSEKYPDIKKGYDYMKTMLANNKHVGAQQKKLDTSCTYRNIHVLDPEWEAINKYNDDRKIEEAKKTAEVIFNISQGKLDKPHVQTPEDLKKQVEEPS